MKLKRSNIQIEIDNFVRAGTAFWRERYEDWQTEVGRMAAASADEKLVLLVRGGDVPQTLSRALVGSPVWERMDAYEAYRALFFAFWPRKRIGDPGALAATLLYSIAGQRTARTTMLVEVARERLVAGGRLFSAPGPTRGAAYDLAAPLTFAAWLAEGAELDRSGSVRGPFARLVAEWPDPSVESLLAICRIHEQEIVDGPILGDAYNLIPLEFVAMNVVRRAQGLAEVSCAHPLFDNPIGKSFVERQTPRYEPKADPLFVSVAEALIREGRTGELDPYVL